MVVEADDDVLLHQPFGPTEAYRLLVADVYELAATSRRTSEHIARELGQTVARWHVLSVLSERPLTVAAAARRLGLARQSVHRVAKELLDDGLLEADANPDHKRAPLLGLTAEGRRVLQDLVARVDEDRARRLARAGVTAKELASARHTVRAVLTALEID